MQIAKKKKKIQMAGAIVKVNSQEKVRLKVRTLRLLGANGRCGKCINLTM